MGLPYLTPAEYLASPTGAVDVNNLVDDGDEAAQTAALTEVIRRASGWIDTTMRPVADRGQPRRVRPRPLAARRAPLLHPKQSPLNELIAVSIGTNAGNLTASPI
jgi:hypothetical protein